MSLSPSIRKKFEQFVRIPVPVAGAVMSSAIGAYITSYTGSPLLGETAGAAINQTIATAADIFARQLSETESNRIGVAIAYAIALEEEYKRANRPLRDDGFFLAQIDDRSSAATIIEGTLLKAKNSFEEKKLPFISFISVTTAHRDNVPAEVANYILNLAERFTYRQLCIVALLYRSAHITKERKWWQGYYFPGPTSYAVLELRNLQDLLEGNQHKEKAPELSSVGKLLFELMRLDRLPEEDLALTVKAFTVDL